MNHRQAADALMEGRTVKLRSAGNSMTPRIKSREEVTLEPVTRSLKKGDAVLAKVNGHLYVHLVTAVYADGRVQISNNHKHVNGIASAVYGIVTAVNP